MNPDAPLPAAQPFGGSYDAADSPSPQNSIAPIPPPAIPDHELIRLIGHGSYGQVWLAKNAVGTLRAVKVVYRATFEKEEHFEREFKGLEKFEPISRSHDGFVDILQLGRNDPGGYFYYVMELADGAEMRKSEIRNPKEARNPNSKPTDAPETIRVSGFGLPSSLEIRHSDLYTPRTLRDDLKQRGALPLAECLTIGLKLASALEHLHARGLVHRDIKPSNIIFVRGEPKLADIGLVTDIDEAHSMVGTVGYIPPEGPGAAQADIYSLGKVLYEAAFGKDRQEFPQLPPDLQTHPDHAGLLELNEILLKACESDFRSRFQSAEQIGAELELIAHGQSVKRKRAVERGFATIKKTGLVVGLIAVLAAIPWFAAVNWKLRQSVPRTQSASPAPISVETKSIAVLPFDNDSPDKADEYLGTSMAEELSSSLTKIPELRVLGRESAASLKKSKDRRSAARQLKLDADLEGRVRKSGHRLELTAQLVNTANGFVLWSETYDREVADIFGIQTDVAEKIAEKFSLKLTETIRARLAIKLTKNLEAYQLYLEGRHYWGTRYSHQERAIGLFQSAIRLDPNFAAAYAGLADCYTDETRERFSGRELFPKALENARKAVELDYRLSEAHSSFARVKCHYEYDWQGAGKEFQLAIRLNPANAMAQRWYSAYLGITGHFDEAIAHAKLAKELDPLSGSIRNILAWNLFNARQYEQALEEFQEFQNVPELSEHMSDALDGVGWCNAVKGKYEAAVAVWEKVNRSNGLSPEKNAELTRAFRQAGMRGYWLKHVEQTKEGADPTNLSPFWIAADYAMLGENDQAFEWLERAYEDRTFYMPWVGVEYRLYGLHSDPRFAELLNKMRLKMPIWKK